MAILNPGDRVLVFDEHAKRFTSVCNTLSKTGKLVSSWEKLPGPIKAADEALVKSAQEARTLSEDDHVVS